MLRVLARPKTESVRIFARQHNSSHLCSLNRTDELASMETVAEAINYNPQELNRIVSDFRQSLKQLSKILNDNKINEQDSTTILRAMGL